MNEAQFRDRLQDKLGGYTLATHGIQLAGVSDVYWTCEGESVWVELKWSESPPQLSHPLTAPQCGFIRDVQQAGTTAGVLCGTPDGLLWQSDIDIGVHHRIEPDESFDSVEEFEEWALLS